MAFQRGEVVLLPFPFTDLSVTKTRPGGVSIDLYHEVRTNLLLASGSSQLDKADPTVDYVLENWSEEGLLEASSYGPRSLQSSRV